MDRRISKPHLNITSKQKVDWLKKQQKKNKERGVLTRSSSSSKPMGSPFCAICVKGDNENNLRAAGTQADTKDAVDAAQRKIDGTVEALELRPITIRF